MLRSVQHCYAFYICWAFRWNYLESTWKCGTDVNDFWVNSHESEWDHPANACTPLVGIPDCTVASPEEL